MIGLTKILNITYTVHINGWDFLCLPVMHGIQIIRGKMSFAENFNITEMAIKIVFCTGLLFLVMVGCDSTSLIPSLHMYLHLYN